MWFRLPRSKFEAMKGEGNKKAMKKLILSGRVPGILAFHGREPVAWCSVAPREDFPALERSRVMARVDNKPVWSVVCFYVTKAYRNQGMVAKLLKAAIDYVKKRGGRMIEGYPVEPEKGRMPDAFAFHGLSAAFRKAGFKECARRSETRPVMRKSIPARRTGAGTMRKRKMLTKDAKVMCKTPTPGKQGVNIDRWKYDLVREAILKAVPNSKTGVPFKELHKAVRKNMTPGNAKKVGSMSWYTTTVKLDLEVRGEIERVPGATPQRLRRK
jgi:GNAT superfamily N-acetyltransferase